MLGYPATVIANLDREARGSVRYDCLDVICLRVPEGVDDRLASYPKDLIPHGWREGPHASLLDRAETRRGIGGESQAEGCESLRELEPLAQGISQPEQLLASLDRQLFGLIERAHQERADWIGRRKLLRGYIHLEDEPFGTLEERVVQVPCDPIALVQPRRVQLPEPRGHAAHAQPGQRTDDRDHDEGGESLERRSSERRADDLHALPARCRYAAAIPRRQP